MVGDKKRPAGKAGKDTRISKKHKKQDKGKSSKTERTKTIVKTDTGFTPIPFLASSPSWSRSKSSIKIYLFATKYNLTKTQEGEGGDSDAEQSYNDSNDSILLANLPLRTTKKQISIALERLTGLKPDSITIDPQRRRAEWDTITDYEEFSSYSNDFQEQKISPLFIYSNPQVAASHFRSPLTAIVTSTAIRKRLFMKANKLGQIDDVSKLPKWPLAEEEIEGEDEDSDEQEVQTQQLSSWDAHFIIRPGLETVAKHVDDWVADFESRPPSQPASISNPDGLHVQQDSDDDGGGEWTLVTRGGNHGRSDNQSIEPSDAVPSEYTSGKVSVGVAKFRDAQKLALKQAEKEKQKQEDYKGFYAFQRRKQGKDNVQGIREKFEHDKETLKAMRRKDRSFKPY